MDARVEFESLLETFGVSATVTRPAPDDTPIDTVGIWLEPIQGDEPSGSGFRRREPVRVIALRKEDVPTLPLGTLIAAAERSGDTVRTWKVDGIDREDADHVRAMVMRAREYDA